MSGFAADGRMDDDLTRGTAQSPKFEVTFDLMESLDKKLDCKKGTVP